MELLTNLYGRFSHEGIVEILELIDLESIPWRTRYKPSAEEAICILLARLSWPFRNKDLSPIFKRSKPYLSSVFNDVILYLYTEYLPIIEWHPILTYDRLQYYCERIERQSPMSRRIWGFIDGTFREVCRPSSGQ